jgi:hypothetical protein
VKSTAPGKLPLPDTAVTPSGVEAGSPEIVPDNMKAGSSVALTTTLAVAFTPGTTFGSSGPVAACGMVALAVVAQKSATSTRVKSLAFIAFSSFFPSNGWPCPMTQLPVRSVLAEDFPRHHRRDITRATYEMVCRIESKRKTNTW